MRRFLTSSIMLIFVVTIGYSTNLVTDFIWNATDQPTSSSTFTSADGLVNISGINGTSPTQRNKEGYAYSFKCRTVIVDIDSSIGNVKYAWQNGSSSTTNTVTISYTTDGITWIDAEVFSLAGNASGTHYPTSILTKGKVKQLKFATSNQSWFLGLTIEKNSQTDSNPEITSIDPAENSNLPASGDITILFDEYIKAGSGEITLGTASINKVEYVGAKAIISYSGFAEESSSLIIPASAIVDLEGNSLVSPISISYRKDGTCPTFISVSPANGSTIHITDLGEESRKIKLTFSEEIKIGTGTISFGTAKVATSISNNILTVSYDGLKYSSDNEIRIPASYITDLSGNSLTSDIVLNFITSARDNTPPSIISKSFSDGDILTSGGSINFTFDEWVTIGYVPIKINGEEVRASNAKQVLGLNFVNLPYNSNIIVDIPSGAVLDTCGNVFAGASFNFTTPQKVKKSIDIVVDKNGSGNYTTLQAAINAVPNNSTTRTIIFLKEGTYKEKIYIPTTKCGISIIGEDVETTVITWDECSQIATHNGVSSPGTDNSYTMLIEAPDFYAENLTVRNDYDYNANLHTDRQAVALEHKNDKHVFKNCHLYSYQDTHYPKTANHRQYFIDCMIQGGTDFIFGSGTSVFENCEIRCVEGGQYITAASDTQQEFGFILNNCIFTYAPDVNMGTKRQFYLGRPWKSPAKTSFVNCKFENNLIRTEGWSIWSGTENHLSAIYNEYNSTNLGGDLLEIGGRVNWSSQIATEEVNRYNADNAFNYGSNNSWNPYPYISAPATPTNFSSKNGIISWSESTLAAGYAIFKNGRFYTTTINTNFTDDNYSIGDDYAVKAYNEYGAMGEVTYLETKVNQTKIDNIITYSNEYLIIAEVAKKINIYSTKGELVVSKTNCNIVLLSSIPKGIYITQVTRSNGELKNLKFAKQ